MKKVLIIIGAILVLGLVGAAGFWGGMKYQENQINQVYTNFEQERPLPGGQAPGGGEFPQGGDFPQDGDFQNPQAQGFMGRGGGLSGQVKTVDGSLITISTAEDVTTLTGEEIMNLLLGLNQEHGITLIIVTHDAAIASRTQRIIRLKDGLIESIKQNENLPVVR